PGGARSEARLAADLRHQIAAARTCSEARENGRIDALVEAVEQRLGVHIEQRAVPGYERISRWQAQPHHAWIEVDFHPEAFEVGDRTVHALRQKRGLRATVDGRR